VARAADRAGHGDGAARRVHLHRDRDEDRAHHGAGAHAERLRGAARLPGAPRVDAPAGAPRLRAPALHAPGELRRRDLRRRVLHHRVRRSVHTHTSLQLIRKNELLIESCARRWVRIDVAWSGQEDVRAGRDLAGQRAGHLQGSWVWLDGWIPRGDQLRWSPKLDSPQKGVAFFPTLFPCFLSRHVEFHS
jgi:hypothetical protein